MGLNMNLGVFSNKNTHIFEKVLLNSLKVNKIQPREVLVIGDIGQKSDASPIISFEYYRAAKNLGLKTNMHIQNHKFNADYIDEVLARKLKALPRESIIIINISNKLGKFDFNNSSFRNFCKKYDHRYLSSSGLKNIKPGQLKYFIQTLDVDFKEQHKFGQKLQNELDNAREVNIQTKAGTDLTLNFEGRKSINNSGIYDDLGKGGNMPAGEIYIPPLENLAYGTLVIDGSVRTWNKTMIPTEPLKIEIENGAITKIHSSQSANLFRDTFRTAARKVKYKERVKMVAELGIGTNKSAKLIGTTIIDEKVFGTAHIAFGSNGWMGGKIKTKSHFDQVFKDPIMRIDGRLFRL